MSEKKVKKVNGKDRGGDKVREERAKLTGSFVSSLGVGVIVIGVARPLFDPSLKGLPGSIDAAVLAISILLGAFLHLFGRWLLAGMRAPARKKERSDDE